MAVNILNQEVVSCIRCPRLVKYREKIGREKRRACKDQEYWAKPPDVRASSSIARRSGATSGRV
jgi:hypothetical protein